MKKHIGVLFVFSLLLWIQGTPAGAEKLTSYVDPFIGTGGHGHTYPGAALPFGMVQLSPDTRLSGWDGCSGYHYSDSVIYGFSHTHLSGTGVSDYGDILLMPTTGPVQLEGGNSAHTDSGYCSSFSHQQETASPGYYGVQLTDYQIDVKLTVTPRCGVHQYTFPSGKEANVIIDLTHRDKLLDSRLKQVDAYQLEGFRRSTAWATDQRLYFVIRFSQPIKEFGLEKQSKGYARFGTHLGGPLLVRVGISAVDADGASKNLDAETNGRRFQQIRGQADKTWETSLSKIRVVSDNQKQKRIFYSALYHVLLNPNLYTDVDGRYLGRDLKIHQADGFTNYTVFSLWDTFRTAHPLFTIIEPERTNHFIRTFLAQYEQGGLLPVWELSANETFCMIGYHAVPVIADAFIKGLRGYDVEKAYEAMKHSAQQDHFGLSAYRRFGYIPAEEESESVSKTVEYAYDDWCIAQTARVLGRQDDYIYYIQRAQNYKNLFDPSGGFLRARMQGTWFTPFDPAEVNFNYTEANAWQYRFYAPQDISGLITLLGGKQKFAAQLDALFSVPSSTTGRKQADITGLIGQYAHGNEPSHHMAYLYAYADQHWKTQQMVRQILNTLYSDQPDGLCGNEDCGQMSAWYVMSALGFYPVTPGSDRYVIGTPLFKKAVVDVGSGKSFTISAPELSARSFYIQGAALNGNTHAETWIRHEDIMKGGTLRFKTGPVPDKQYGTKKDAPESAIKDHFIQPVPHVVSGSRAFETGTTVSLGTIEAGADIYYSLDRSTTSSSRKLYTGPISIDRTVTIRAVSQKSGIPDSKELAARFARIPGGRDMRLLSRYAPPYSAGGDKALIDGITGGTDFRTGAWQGFEGTHLEAIIDLGKTSPIKQISVGFLQDNNAWIFLPVKVVYYLSQDGKQYKSAGEALNDVSLRQEGAVVKRFTLTIAPRSARYLKIKAVALLNCPDWHKGAGNKSWIFADEVQIDQPSPDE